MNKFYKVFKDPSIIWLKIRKYSFTLFANKYFVAANHNRSDSENGLYLSAVIKATSNYAAFSNFKSNPLYKDILEHVTYDQGIRYIFLIQRDSPQLLKQLDFFKKNDLLGAPECFEYPEIGLISPTTLRYIKVASDLLKYFGQSIGQSVVEIGVGYGGQALILDQVFDIQKYELLDLPPVLELASKYLESHILKSSYVTSTLNQKAGDQNYDAVISNYAFSELPESLQLMYIKKIILKSKRGYLTMNSGLGKSPRSNNKLTLAQLQNLLPNIEIIEEDPLTDIENYIIIWGHNDVKV